MGRIATKDSINSRLTEAESPYKMVGEYKGNSTPTEFVCKHHPKQYAPWIVRPDNVISGNSRCPKCGTNAVVTNEYIDNWLCENSPNVIRQSEYVSAKRKMLFFCLKHSEQFTRSWDTVKRTSGCLSCARESYTAAKMLTNKIFDSYIADNSVPVKRLGDYLGSSKNILVECTNAGCGNVWESTFDTIRASNKGCPRCAGKEKWNNCTVDDFIESLGLGYVRESDYTNYDKHMTISCPKHGCWNITLNNLKRGRRCPGCARNGFDPKKASYLYYAKLGEIYKVGITRNKPQLRVSTEHDQAVVLKQVRFSSGFEARLCEQFILQKFKGYLVDGRPFGVTSGWTETFSVDVIGDTFESVILEFLETL